MRARLYHPIFGRLPRQSGLLLASASGGGGGTVYVLPTPPTPSTGSTSVYTPTLTSGPTGKDGYRPWISAIVDGVQCFANGWDQPWRWDEGSNFYPLGSTAPTTFAVNDAAGGSTFPITTVVTYYLVFAVSSLGKETAPQLTGTVAGVSHTMVATKDITITWTDPGGEYDKARIYRRLAGSDDYKLVAEVTASTATYTDSTTDATLATATSYVTTYRTTLPPIFEGMISSGNRLWGWTGDDPSVYYAQVARTDSRFVADDFPSANQLPIEPNDAFGAIRGGWDHNGSRYFFKEQASYQVQGDDPSNFVVTRMYAGRGCLSQRAMIEMDDGSLVILDALGIYAWVPGGEPAPLGVTPSGMSRMAPIWKRMNLGACKSFWVQHVPQKNLLRFWIALDYEPIANYPVVYDYKKNIFLNDPGVWGAAGAIVEDAAATRHIVRVCDLGIVWADEVGNSDGVYAGTTNPSLTSGTATLWTASAASFDTTTASGCLGSFVRRYNSSGTLIDENRVAAISSTTITPLYWNSTTAASTQTAYVGAIPAAAKSGKKGFDTDLMKHITTVVMEHAVEASSSYTLDFQTSADEDAFARPSNITTTDLSGNEGRTPINVSDRCWRWRWQIAQTAPGMSFTVRALTVHLDFLGTPR